MMAIVDLSHMYYVNLTMQHAVREGARYAVTGQTGLDPDPAVSAMDRCNAARQRIIDGSVGLFTRVSAQVSFKTVDAAGNVVTLGSGSCYGAGQIIVISVDANVDLITPLMKPLFANGEYAFNVSATMRNEAF